MTQFSIKISAFVILATIGFAFVQPQLAKKSYKVNTTDSNVVWTGEKVLGSHTGNVSLKDGEFILEDNQLVGGGFTVDMTSMTNTDLDDEGSQNKLMGHLKSDDFFGVEKYPTADFKITNVVSRGKAGDYRITGDMTIKGHTEEIRFNATLNPDGEKLKGLANITIDRTKYDIRYGSGSFFEDLGDKTIYDEFKLDITIVADGEEATMMSKDNK